MKICLKMIVIGCVIVLFTLGPIACEKKGPAEKAGEKIDETVNAVKDQVKKATE